MNDNMKKIYCPISIQDIMPTKKLRMVLTWIDIHQEKLIADGNMLTMDGGYFKVK